METVEIANRYNWNRITMGYCFKVERTNEYTLNARIKSSDGNYY